MRKTFATMLTMGLAAGFAAAQTPGSGVGSGGNTTATTQNPGGAAGTAGSGAGGTAGSATGGAAGSQSSGATGTGGATSSRGAAVGGTQGAGGTTGSSGTTRGTTGSNGAGGTGTGAGAGTTTGRGSLGGQGTGAAGAAGAQDLPGRGTRGTAGSATGAGSDLTRSGAASDPAGAQMTMDTLFAASAAVGGMAEVGTSRIAMERAGSDEIKMFAQRMVEDHTRTNRELIALTTQKGFQQPRGLDVKDQADVMILSSLRGEDFDKAYAKQQLAAHICMVNQFTAAAERGQDPELKAWAAKTLPALKEHKTMIKGIVDKYEKAEQGNKSPGQ